MIKSQYGLDERILIVLLFGGSQGAKLEDFDTASTLEELLGPETTPSAASGLYQFYKHLVEFTFQVEIPPEAGDWNRKLPIWQILMWINDARKSVEAPKPKLNHMYCRHAYCLHGHVRHCPTLINQEFRNK